LSKPGAGKEGDRIGERRLVKGVEKVHANFQREPAKYRKLAVETHVNLGEWNARDGVAPQ
jgi:hypothetical protein